MISPTYFRLANRRNALLTLAAASAITMGSSAQAGQYVWNGGDNTWDTISANWTGAGTVWPNTSPSSDEARFNTGPQTVTIAAATTIDVNTMSFGIPGYTFQGADGGSVLRFSGTSPLVTSATNNGGATFDNLRLDTGDN